MISVEIPVAWGEMDAYNHVNNAVFLRWFETARVDWFQLVSFPEKEGNHGPVLRVAKIEYLRSVKHPDTVTVSVGATRVGRASVALSYSIASRHSKEVVATGETIVVLVDYAKHVAIPLPEDACDRIRRLGMIPVVQEATDAGRSSADDD